MRKLRLRGIKVICQGQTAPPNSKSLPGVHITPLYYLWVVFVFSSPFLNKNTYLKNAYNKRE